MKKKFFDFYIIFGTPDPPPAGPEPTMSDSSLDGGAPFAFNQLYLRAPEELCDQPQHNTYGREALRLVPHV